MAIRRMHFAGIVHGDLTTSNILFRVAKPVVDWTDDEVHQARGIEKLSRLADLSILQECVTIIDFGQSYFTRNPPKDYEPATTMHYQSPEMRFDGRIGIEANIWLLGCAIFEIRAGYPLFEALFGNANDILRQIAQTLGRLPYPWWAAFRNGARWFDNDGEPKDMLVQKQAGVSIPARKTPIVAKVRSIGDVDQQPSVYDGAMLEMSGVRLSEEEVALLSDLLERMSKYRPEERATIEEVVHHRWFNL
ncbi:kinase-like protein [Punctularia strigosozonata HHB-11173 SS5]|uniref:kinase-like protein n=1 Tax=Punctularia strigosozonata (strain HHB-11173) TaxID=741275 RepID=UPI0004416A8A|nr:kinase-like protein [Punctularia strigosozonata HHB-11173 SS5]EIN11904.1 kinase-like protein [Punctularia strigosozonata HHB-11173 SS5]